MTVYVIVQLKMTDRAAYDRYQARFFDVFKKFSGRLLSADENPLVLEGTWDRDKPVLMSFPDKAAYLASAFSRLSGIRLAARKCAQSIFARILIEKPGSTFAEYARADSPEYQEISKDRKAGAPATVLLAKGFQAGIRETQSLPARPESEAKEERYRHAVRVGTVVSGPIIIIGLVM